MIEIRKSKDRGYFDHGWLKTFHTFSFADYFDQRFHHFRALRVINEDFVSAGNGFGTHSHQDMEIITYVLEGALTHKDSMGNGSTIRPGDVQFMSAGSGVTHSEFNHSKDENVHLMQIWIFPAVKGLAPRYAQKHFDESEKVGKLRLVCSGDGREGSIQIGQDADLYAGLVDSSETLELKNVAKRFYWVQVLRGSVHLNGLVMEAGDGASLSEEADSRVIGKGPGLSEVLVFDLA